MRKAHILGWLAMSATVVAACSADPVDDLFEGFGGADDTTGAGPTGGQTTSSTKAGSGATQATGAKATSVTATNAQTSSPATGAPATNVTVATTAVTTGQTAVASTGSGVIVEDCFNLADDDLDGKIDCSDPDCLTSPLCVGMEICGNGIDDNADGAADCADVICLLTDPNCLQP